MKRCVIKWHFTTPRYLFFVPFFALSTFSCRSFFCLKIIQMLIMSHVESHSVCFKFSKPTFQKYPLGFSSSFSPEFPCNVLHIICGNTQIVSVRLFSICCSGAGFFQGGSTEWSGILDAYVTNILLVKRMALPRGWLRTLRRVELGECPSFQEHSLIGASSPCHYRTLSSIAQLLESWLCSKHSCNG